MKHSAFRGFTLMELLIAITLVGLFSTVIARTLIDVTDSVNTTMSRARAEEQSRLGLSALSRLIEGARALGACSSGSSTPPVFTVKLADCKKVTEYGPAFADAKADTMTFYSYSSDSSASTSGTGAKVLKAPDKVTITADTLTPEAGQDSAWYASNKFLVAKMYAPSPGRTYTDTDPASASAWVAAPSDSTSIGVIQSGSVNLFEYYDSQGNLLTPATGQSLTAEERAKIAVVVVHPTLRWTSGSSTGDISPSLFVSIPSMSYGAGAAG